MMKAILIFTFVLISTLLYAQKYANPVSPEKRQFILERSAIGYFDDMAVLYSIHKSREKRGKLGYVSLLRFNKTIKAKIKKTPVNSVSNWFLTDNTYYLFLVEDKKLGFYKLAMIRLSIPD